MRPNHTAELLAAGELAINSWISNGDPYTAEVLGHCGYDAITVDLQHGMFGVESAIACLQFRPVLAGSGALPSSPETEASRPPVLAGLGTRNPELAVAVAAVEVGAAVGVRIGAHGEALVAGRGEVDLGRHRRRAARIEAVDVGLDELPVVGLGDSPPSAPEHGQPSTSTIVVPPVQTWPRSVPARSQQAIDT